jgi:hypothetical protein
MSKKEVKENIEEVLIRLIGLEWTLDSLKRKELCSIKCLLDFFKNEVKECLISLDKFYSEISNKEKKVLKKPKKGTKNAKTDPKRKTKKSTQNKKSKK